MNLTTKETEIIRVKRPIPKKGPVAIKTTDKAAGKNIPKPLRPIRCLEAAITVAITGRRSSKTMVLAGTPASTDPLIAYLRGFVGQTGPSSCLAKSSSKGPSVSWVFWVKSGTGEGTGSMVGVADAVAVGERVGLAAETDPVRAKNTINDSNKLINFLMG